MIDAPVQQVRARLNAQLRHTLLPHERSALGQGGLAGERVHTLLRVSLDDSSFAALQPVAEGKLHPEGVSQTRIQARVGVSPLVAFGMWGWLLMMIPGLLYTMWALWDEVAHWSLAVLGPGLSLVGFSAYFLWIARKANALIPTLQARLLAIARGDLPSAPT